MYNETKKIAEANGYAVFELAESVGGRTHTLWGPDIHGRFCRNGAYSDSGSAMQAFRMLAKPDAKE